MSIACIRHHLTSFRSFFDKSMDLAEKASLASKRVNNIIDSLTFISYRYINRGLYEKDKISFKLILLFKILIAAGKLEARLVGLFLRGGSALDINSVRVKMLTWLSNEAWLNIIQLSNASLQFKSLPEDIELNESQFLPWFNENEPEKFPVPIIETRFSALDEVLQNFYQLRLWEVAYLAWATDTSSQSRIR
jgi:dynein heavy chain